MPMLQFMPWCRLDKKYNLGELEIIPFNRYEVFKQYDPLIAYRIRQILTPHRGLHGEPVTDASLVKFHNKDILADLTEEERNIAFELIQLACFTGLSSRDYFDPHGNYCCSDCFKFYIQRFQEEPTAVGMVLRKMEGSIGNLMSTDKLTITQPNQVAIQEFKLDESFLAALIQYRSSSTPEDWTRLMSAVSCFNQANTDNETVHYQMEWVLLNSAIQHFLDAGYKLDELTEKFTQAIMPYFVVKASDSKRKTDDWKEPDRPLRFYWIKEFYIIRNDYAHGKLNPKRSFSWEPLEHLVLAKIVFPLLVKLKLKETGSYELIDNDVDQIDTIEKLADEKFLEPIVRKNEPEKYWYRILMEEQQEKRWKEKLHQQIEEKLSKRNEKEQD